LGSLNEQGLYGRPNEYINIWKQAAEMGSLEAMTDMGYLYEKGVDNE
jgi:TPR repeat protein